MQPDFVDATIPVSAYVSAGKASTISLGPESFTSVTSTSPLHAKNLQPVVGAIPISVFVSAGKVPIRAPGNVVFRRYMWGGTIRGT